MSEVIKTPISASKDEHLHVVFVVDTTASMGTYLTALKHSLCQVCSLLHVLYPDSSADLSIICYKDFGDGDQLIRPMIQKPFKKLYTFCSGLIAGGGGDIAEASKTALVYLSKLIAGQNWKEDTTIVFHYTDAPPHHKLTNPDGNNRPKEENALKETRLGSDWCKISRRFRKISDRVKLFTIAPEDSPAAGCGAAFYALLGELIVLPDTSANLITKTTMSLLLQLTGQENESTFRRVALRSHSEVMEKLDSLVYNEDTCPELNTIYCHLPTFNATPKNTQDLVWMTGWVCAAVHNIEHDDAQLKIKFKQSEPYREAVFESMEKLVQPENVLALASYPVLGRMWRLVCSCRDDPRLVSMQAKMGNSMSSKSLTDSERAELKLWLENSYDYSEEMNEVISAQKESHRYYVMDTFSTVVPDVNGLRSLARSPDPKALSSVQQILSHVMLVSGDGVDPPVDSDGNCQYLPETLSDYELFTMLPHLIQPGTKYSLKPAAMLAILVCKSSNSLLENRAKSFLASIKGKWLPPVDRIDRAEIISYEFSSLIANCPVEDALADAEKDFFRRLHDIWRYRRSRFETFEVLTPISPKKPMLLPDSKKLCQQCKLWTSETLVDQNGVCGVCLWENESKDNRWERPTAGEDYFVKESESYMVECTGRGGTCRALYAVLGPSDLNVPPKCHYCRFKRKDSNKGAPYRRCGNCKAKWCTPSLKANDESGDYVCPVCSVAPSGGPPATATSTHQVSLQKLIEQNPTWVRRFGFFPKSGKIIFSGTGMYKAVSVAENRAHLFSEPATGAPIKPLLHAGKHILNEEAALSAVKERVATSTFVDTCQLCYNDMAVERLRPSCGHCTNQCCKDCLTAWYGQNAPGQLFTPSNDGCPFCRRRPTYEVLRNYNHAACAIVGLSRRKGRPLSLRSDWYYGWCRDCWKVAYAMARSCAEGAPQLMDFTCEDCQEKAQLRRAVEQAAEQAADDAAVTEMLLEEAKPCPSCKIRTMHMGGCSHMTCTNCSTHWCWQCGVFSASNGADVYDHMHAHHGGYGWVDE